MGFRACLIDVYETVVTCDFAAHAREMPVLAGMPTDRWNDAFLALGGEINDGRLTIADAYARVLGTRDHGTDPELVNRMARRDRELLVETTRIHDDTVPFLEMLRARGIATAFVSNCAENTRPLLDHLGLSALVDSLVLSCEVGSAKPDAAIYQAALDQLGVPAEDCLFVDDQPSYCDGARALGITSACICREVEPAGHDELVVRSLLDLEHLF